MKTTVVFTSKTKNKLVKISGGILAVLVAAVTTYAFSSPTTGPGESNSSAGSLISRMAGDNFEKGEHSLVAIAEKLTSIEDKLKKCGDMKQGEQESIDISNPGKSIVTEISEQKLANAKIGDTGKIQDKRGSEVQNYTWRKMKDGRVWMTQNLRTNIDRDGNPFNKHKGECHLYSEDDGCQFGRVYAWSKVMLKPIQDGSKDYQDIVCPSGWRIPTIEEWNLLANKEGRRSLRFSSFGPIMKGTYTDHLGSWSSRGVSSDYLSSTEKDDAYYWNPATNGTNITYLAVKHGKNNKAFIRCMLDNA